MAIITAIMAPPAFNKQSTIREQVHAFACACSEYLRLQVRRSAKMFDFPSCCDRCLSTFVTTSTSPSPKTRHAQVREQVLQFENVTQSWNPTRVQQQLLMPSLPASGNQSTDMDVDEEGAVSQIKGKGKDKGKGKNKKKDKGAKTRWQEGRPRQGYRQEWKGQAGWRQKQRKCRKHFGR